MTDASATAVSATLIQDGNIVLAASKTLRPAQRKYSATHREFLGVKFGLKRFRPYLLHRQFDALTDHQPLVAMMRKDQLDNQRLEAIRASIAEFLPYMNL